MFKLDLDKAEEPEIKFTTLFGSQKKQEGSRKTSISASLTMPKPLTMWTTTNREKFLKRWEYQTTWPTSSGFPDSSTGKESTCNAGDPGSILGLGRSTGEGIGYPLQYSWASLVLQLVKNLPAVKETWVRSLGWEDPLEKGKVTHSSILACRIP